MIYKTGSCTVTQIFTAEDKICCDDCASSYSVVLKECPVCGSPNSKYSGFSFMLEDDGEVN